MRERWEQILRILCLVLLGLMVYRVSMVIKHGPLTGLAIPAIPTLIETNNVAAVKPTNAPAKPIANKGTNSTTVATTPATNGTNAGTITNLTKPATNSAATNSSPGAVTNTVIAAMPAGPNGVTNAAGAKGTNSVVSARGKSGTNRVQQVVAAEFPPGFPGGPNKAPELPPIIQGRINKIIVSEIFAQMMHPQPSELMGIAGNYAFLRSSSGQMGMVKEGDSLGGLKLLELGINRALIEEDGEKKELMIFSGFGSETLMPKQKENTNDIAKKSP